MYEDDDEVYYNLSDLYRYNEFFNLNLTEEKIKKFCEKEKYNQTKFTDKIAELQDRNEERDELDIGYAEYGYERMIDWYEWQIPKFKDESTRESVHRMVKELYDDLTKLNYHNFVESPYIIDYNSIIDYETDKYDFDIKLLNTLYVQREDKLKGAIFEGLYSVGENFYKLYDFYKNSTFDDVYSKIESLKSPYEGYGYVGGNDKEFYNGRFFNEDGDMLLTLLALIACSKFEKDLDISKAFLEKYSCGGYAEENEKMDFYSLLPIVKECKKLNDEQKKENNKQVKQKVLKN